MVRVIQTQHKNCTQTSQGNALRRKRNWFPTTGELTDGRLIANYNAMLEGKTETKPFFFTEGGMKSYKYECFKVLKDAQARDVVVMRRVTDHSLRMLVKPLQGPVVFMHLPEKKGGPCHVTLRQLSGEDAITLRSDWKTRVQDFHKMAVTKLLKDPKCHWTQAGLNVNLQVLLVAA